MTRRRLWTAVTASVLAAVSVLGPVGSLDALARPVLPDGQRFAAVSAKVAASRAGPALVGAATGTDVPAPADGHAATDIPQNLDGAAAVAVVVSDRVRLRLGWAWPLAPPVEVARAFDPPDQPWLPGHRGVDLSASVGAPLRAPHAGTVTFSGVIAGRGVLVVTHGDGLRSTFEPVQDTVPAGTVVSAGQQVATVSAVAGHCAPSTCVHWGVLSGDRYLDPLAVLGKVRVILLPLDSS